MGEEETVHSKQWEQCIGLEFLEKAGLSSALLILFIGCGAQGCGLAEG